MAQVICTPADDWEIIDILDAEDEEEDESIICCDEECQEPELNESSAILSREECAFLRPFLPAAVRCSPWNLVYSTSLHGYGLPNLYRQAANLDMPTVFVVQDVHQHVFGAIIPCPPRHRFKFEGNGECALFQIYPHRQMYPWCGRNYNIVMGDNNGISVGCQNGSFALWLDQDLNRGRTSSCDTFLSDPLCPCARGEFAAKTVELWSF